MARRLGESIARMIGLMFVLAGAWMFFVNVLNFSYSSPLIWFGVISLSALGLAGGVLYLLSFDGPPAARTRVARLAGFAGMFALAAVPTSLIIVLWPALLLAIPTLVVKPAGVEMHAPTPA